MVSCDNNYPCIEKDYVRDTYNAIAEHFSATRGYHWECVKDFLRDVPPNSTVFEVGCGNGKNFLCTDSSKNIVFSGCDVSEEMVDLARKRVYEKTRNDSAVTSSSPSPRPTSTPAGARSANSTSNTWRQPASTPRSCPSRHRCAPWPCAPANVTSTSSRATPVSSNT